METYNVLPEQQDEQKVDELLRTATLPPEIDFVTKEFKEDHSGMPSIYLSFQLRPDIRLDRKTLERISRFIVDFRRTLIQSGVSRFPYSSLDEAA